MTDRCVRRLKPPVVIVVAHGGDLWWRRSPAAGPLRIKEVVDPVGQCRIGRDPNGREHALGGGVRLVDQARIADVSDTSRRRDGEGVEGGQLRLHPRQHLTVTATVIGERIFDAVRFGDRLSHERQGSDASERIAIGDHELGFREHWNGLATNGRRRPSRAAVTTQSAILPPDGT